MLALRFDTVDLVFDAISHVRQLQTEWWHSVVWNMLTSCDHSTCACSYNCIVSARRWLVSLWRACQRSLCVSTVACPPVSLASVWNVLTLRHCLA
jgi:hypothetical protein